MLLSVNMLILTVSLNTTYLQPSPFITDCLDEPVWIEDYALFCGSVALSDH